MGLIQIYCDGGCRGNQNTHNLGGYGIVIEKDNKVYEEYGVENTQYKGNVILVSENSNLDTAPLDKLLNATDNGLIKEVVTSSSTNAQYILEVVNIDADELKDEVIEEFINDSELSEKYLAKLFSKHKFKLYDQHLYDAFKENLPEYIK